MLCIKIAETLFKNLNKLYFNFIWKGGEDRVKRDFLCLDYSLGGLRMVNVKCFAEAQKLTWVKYLLDDNYECMWKSLELSFLHISSIWMLKFCGNLMLLEGSFYFKDYRDHDFPNTEFSYFLTIDTRQ